MGLSRDVVYAAEVVIRNLVQRKLIVLSAEGYAITDKGNEIVTYYAASLEHLTL